MKSRRALTEALDRREAAERKTWMDAGREREYDKLKSDPYGLLTPLPDGSARLFTCMRFHDEDIDYMTRRWVHDLLGADFVRVHDDPRGIFIYPDVCEPREQSYDAIIDEIGKSGRFLDGAPPSREEVEAYDRKMEQMSAAIAARAATYHAAQAAGDELTVRRMDAEYVARQREGQQLKMDAALASLEAISSDDIGAMAARLQGMFTIGDDGEPELVRDEPPEPPDAKTWLHEED